MANLTTCLQKVGAKLDPADKAAVMARSRELRTLAKERGEPMSATDAARQAAKDVIAEIRAELKAAEPAQPTQRKSSHPKTVMGSELLALVSARLGGLDPALLSEYSVYVPTGKSYKNGQPRMEWRNPMIPGVGKLFRRGGRQDRSEIAQVLEDADYMEPGAVANDYKEAGERAKELIKAALDRNIPKTLSEQQAEMEASQEAERKAYYDALDEESAAEADAERAAIMAEAGMSRLEIGAVVDDDLTNMAGTTDTATQMRAMGFTEQEIADELAREAQPQAEAAQASAGQDAQAGPEAAPAAGPAGVAAAQRGSEPAEGLTLEAQTPEALKAKATREKAAAEADAKEQKRLAAKAKADAEAPEFTLTGSDRPADVAAAAGQGDIFDQPAESSTRQAPVKQAATGMVPAGLNVTFGGKTYPVESIEDAQRKWTKFQESADDGGPAGVSQIGNGIPVKDGAGRLVARVAYNGRAFDPQDNLIAEAPASAPVEQDASRFADNKVFTQSDVDAARALLKKKLGQVNSGIDPELMQAGITIAGAYIESGARKFADFARVMVDDLGERVKPYLKSWFMALREDPRAAAFRDEMDKASAVEDLDVDAVLAAPKPEPAAPTPLLSRVSQKLEQTRDLIIQHNLTVENLLHAASMGGIPVPSLAVTKADAPLVNFGEITLIGAPEMADPKGYAGAKVFGADIYSPRYPSVEFKLDTKAQRAFNEVLAPFRKEGDREMYGGEVRRPDDITSYKPFKRWAADRYGLDENATSWAQLTASANALMRQIGAGQRIFQGFTYSGNRRYIYHTLDNVVKILKKEIRGGENFNYGVGSLRAKFTPQFRSVEQIRKAKGRLVDKQAFESIKKEVDDEFIALSNEFDLSLEQTSEVIEDAAKMGAMRSLKRAFVDYRRGIEPTIEQAIAVGDFARKLETLPTEYFEAKILRAVDVAEFKVAVVPSDAPQEAIDYLTSRGVKVEQYDKGTEDARAKQIKAAADKHQVLFSRTADTTRGVALSTLKPHIDAIKAKMPGLRNTVEVVGTVTDLPADIVSALRSMNALGTVRGLRMPDGRVFLVADKLDSRLEAEFVLFHEVYGHEGLRAILTGDEYASAMTLVRLSNKKVATEADQWMSSYGADQIDARIQNGMTPEAARREVRLLAIEEALADRAGKNDAPSVWKNVMAAIQKALRRMGMNDLANWLENRTEAETYALLMQARKAITSPKKVHAFTPATSPLFQRVWHGTPHEFDKFDTSAIGTGEGAQAYGYGLYFASRREVAEHYRKTLSKRGVVRVAGKELAEQHGMFAAQIRNIADAMDDGVSFEDARQQAVGDMQFRESFSRRNGYADDEKEAAAAVASLKALTTSNWTTKSGQLLEVEIPEDGEMLLWDRPLSEQPVAVREALYAMPGQYVNFAGARVFYESPKAWMTGQQVYKNRAIVLGSDAAASKALADAGIKGIKYLDGVSRNKPLRDVKREFLAELPEDAGFDEVMELIGTGTFSPKNEAVLRALADNDWLGFDYPSQAISTALSSQLSNFDPSPELVQAVAATQDDSTYNYVIFSGDDVAIQQALLSRRPPPLAPAVTVQPDENGNPEFAGDGVVLAYPQPAERFEFIPGPGQRLLNYAIMPAESFDSMGFVELVVENGRVTSLMDIEVNGAGRRAGVGRKVIETILAANPDADVNISNIVHQARGFWAKMGVPEQNLEDGAAYDGTLNWQAYAQAANDGRAAQVGQGMRGETGADDRGRQGADRRPASGAQAPVLSQRDPTQTPAFKRWFGDSVVTKDGKPGGVPMVVYHGTSADFTAFAYGDPVHFAADPDTASRYANIYRPSGGQGARVLPVYLSLKNPKHSIAIPRGDDIARAKQEGHDGFILGGDGHFVVFRPEQIKSAIGNAGTFDPSNPSILLSQKPAPAATGTPAPIATTAQQNLPATRAAIPASWRDPTNRLQFAPGEWLYNALGRLAAPLLVKMQFKAATPEMRRQLRQMKLDVQKAQDVAVAVAGETTKLSEAEREMVSDIIEREVAAGTVPPAHAVRLAAMMNQAMGEQSKELVRLGMLTQEAADRWDGTYLPRFYESKLKKQVGDAWADAVKRLGGRTSVMRGVKGSHLKSRGIFEPIAAKDLDQWEQMGWEIRDPDYPAGTKAADLTARMNAGLLQPDEPIQMWRDYTRAERDKMGEIRDAGFRFVMGYMQTQRDIALGRMFEKMAADPASSSRIPKEGWVQVPNTIIEGTGARRYGKLSGRYVPKETLSHLSQIEESQSAAWQFYRQGMAIWKMGKTAMNPVSHMNNVLSNLTMAHFAGVSYHRADKYVAAIKDFATAAPAIKEARDAGLFLGTMSDAELMNTLPKELQELAGKAESSTVKGAKRVFDLMTFFLRKKMGAAYQAEDTFFRYLIYKDARGRGVSPDDAIDYAQKFIFTYDDLPKGARMVRDFGIPFFAYTYKAVPALLSTALTHPVRFAAPAAVLWAANAMAYAIAAGDDDDTWAEILSKYLNDEDFRAKVREQEKLERENLPPWMKGTTALSTPKAIRLGMDEVTKLPLFIDVARIIPGGDIFDVSPNAGGIPLPQPITPSHPLFSIATGMIANKDLWTGKELVDKNDTRIEAAEKRSEWMWKQISPAMAIGNYHWERGMNALAQASGGEIKWLPEFIAEDYTGVGRDRLPVQPGLAAMQTFGIKVRPIDIEKSIQMEGFDREKMIRGITAEYRTLSRLNQAGVISDTRLEKERAKTEEKVQRLREGLTVDGDARP